MTRFKFEVLRRGAPFAELQVPTGMAPEIAYKPDGEVKMTLSGTFRAPVGINYITDQVRVVMTRDGVEHPMGKFVLIDPVEQYSGRHCLVEITGMDMTYEAQQSCVEARPSYAAQARYTDVIRRLLVESGITKYYIEPSDAVLQTVREDWEPGTPRLTIINDLLTELNYRSLWADRDGMVRAEAYRQPVAKDISHEYRHGANGVLLPALQRTWNLHGLHNVFRVYVDSPDYPAAMAATAENSNPASPVSTVSRNKRIVQVVNLPNIASAAHLQTYANNLCIKEQIATETITFSTALEPMHGCADVLALYRDNVSGIYQEYGWSLQAAANGTYSHTARKVLYLL